MHTSARVAARIFTVIRSYADTPEDVAPKYRGDLKLPYKEDTGQLAVRYGIIGIILEPTFIREKIHA
jgi:hypothetical protein